MKTSEKYPYLGTYGTLIDEVIAGGKRFKKPVINEEHRHRIKKILTLPGFDKDVLPCDIKIERTWTRTVLTALNTRGMSVMDPGLLLGYCDRKTPKARCRV